MKLQKLSLFISAVLSLVGMLLISPNGQSALNGPLVIDEGQPKVLSSVSGSCNATSYPLFLSTHVPCVSTEASSNWDQNKQGVCRVRQKAMVMKELGKVIGPVTACLLRKEEKKSGTAKSPGSVSTDKKKGSEKDKEKGSEKKSEKNKDKDKIKVKLQENPRESKKDL